MHSSAQVYIIPLQHYGLLGPPSQWVEKTKLCVSANALNQEASQPPLQAGRAGSDLGDEGQRIKALRG